MKFVKAGSANIPADAIVLKDFQAHGLVPTWYEDLIPLLSQKTYTEHQIRLALFRLGRLRDFGLIIPRRLLTSITCPVESSEMDYEGWPEADADAYKSWDAIMIRKPAKQ